MTTMELEAHKAKLVREILTEVDNMDLLKKLQNAYEKLKSQAVKDQTISKEEILKGIDSGLKDVKAGKTRSAKELLDEL
ncbi:hypothetical protein [Parabacteroides gordonii]|uniref:Uncharacterized protein n=1 Tax=Parabacteroides gordonii MS-1 = DSM 23371 TaxID=1203610 RepID=A0A0F5JL57_9BACT|nr:hypothetical protein [Parabacteroides gordonii]KKB58320.1 hypothetical protein HMPREF1536_01195 [Parabacteroides gordonii MS-1 = DSM 23371]MCA5583408.1 hypothetical protein [Parabacteroides gordonii]RGP16080.1 hypothetical protein DXB27_13855 [Parabacteroides gordonii]